MWEMIFFFIGIALGQVLYGGMLAVTLLVARRLLPSATRLWQRIAINILRPCLDALGVYLITTLAIQLTRTVGTKGHAYIAGEISVGILLVFLVAFTADLFIGVLFGVETRRQSSAPHRKPASIAALADRR